MTCKNAYRKSSHLGTVESRKIIRYFCEDIPASKTSKLLHIDRNTVNSWYNYIREVMYEYCEYEKNEVLQGTIEVDESYFGARRVRGKRGRGAYGKTKVFGLLKRNGKVYTEIIDDVSSKTLLPIIRGKVNDESVINTDGRKSYDGLVDLGYEKHYRVNHSANEFSKGDGKHINGIESYRSFTKRRLNKFNGIKKEKYNLHLKESEFRFNCGLQKENMYKKLLKILKIYTQLV